MSSNEFNELLNSLKSQSTQSNSLGMNDEALYVWKPVPIVSSPFKEAHNIPIVSTQPTVAQPSFPPFAPVAPVAPVASLAPSLAQPSVTPTPLTIIQQPYAPNYAPNLSANSYQLPSFEKDSSVYSYNPPSTIYQSYSQNPHQYLQPVQPPVALTLQEDKKNFWFEWSVYIFGFALILFIIFFALWYFYVKDYNKIYPLNEATNNSLKDNYKIPPPSYLQTKILEKNPHFDDEIIREPVNVKFKETMENAEELLHEENEVEEYFKPETIMETLYEEKKEKDKKKKSYFDLSDIDSSEFETKEKPIVKMDGGKLTDESDEVKKYAEKRSKLFS